MWVSLNVSEEKGGKGGMSEDGDWNIWQKLRKEEVYVQRKMLVNS